MSKTELGHEFSMPMYGTWNRDENGYLTAIFPRDSLPTEPDYIGVGFCGYGTGGAIPDNFVSWDDFSSLSEEIKTKIYNSLEIAVKPPKEYEDNLIEIIDAFTNPYESKSDSFYEKHKSIFGEDVYMSHNPPQKDDITANDIDDCLDNIDISPIQPCDMYFSRPETISAFGEPNENGYLPNIRLKLPKVKMINITNNRIIPFTIQQDMGEDDIIEYEKDDNYWVQYHPKSSVNQVQAIKSFKRLLSD
jgi:hypothetical protein